MTRRADREKSILGTELESQTRTHEKPKKG
jgi:hypothetical protein